MQNRQQGHTAIERYFMALDAGRFEEALATLSDDCVYIRPPVASGTGFAPSTLEAHSGKASVRAFLERRGRLPITHDIHA